MSKFQLMLTSLVAVIPGAFLIFLLITALLQFSDKMSVVAYGILGGTLLSMVVTVLMPVGILFGRRRKAPAPVSTVKSSGGDAEVLDEDIEVAGDDGEEIELGDSMAEAIDDFDEDSMEGASESDLHIATSEFDLGGESFNAMDAIDDESMIATDPVDDFDSLEMDEEDVFEEEEPKPKKKKR